MLPRIFASGLIFLILTVALNLIASLLRLASWYDFLKAAGQQGIPRALGGLSPLSLVWLFVGYPLCLGLFVYLLRNLVSTK